MVVMVGMVMMIGMVGREGAAEGGEGEEMKLREVWRRDLGGCRLGVCRRC